MDEDYQDDMIEESGENQGNNNQEQNINNNEEGNDNNEKFGLFLAATG